MLAFLSKFFFGADFEINLNFNSQKNSNRQPITEPKMSFGCRVCKMTLKASSFIMVEALSMMMAMFKVSWVLIW